jgi:nitric oxide reductase large subunit
MVPLNKPTPTTLFFASTPLFILSINVYHAMLDLGPVLTLVFRMYVCASMEHYSQAPDVLPYFFSLIIFSSFWVLRKGSGALGYLLRGLTTYDEMDLTLLDAVLFFS